MSRWRGGDLVAVSAGVVVACGCLAPWLSAAAEASPGETLGQASIAARVLVGSIGVLLVAAGLRRSGWTGDLVVGGAAGAGAAVVVLAVMTGGIEHLAFGAFLVLSGCALAAVAAFLNAFEYETSAELRVIEGAAGAARRPRHRPRHRGDHHARSQVRNSRTRANTSNGRS